MCNVTQVFFFLFISSVSHSSLSVSLFATLPVSLAEFSITEREPLCGSVYVYIISLSLEDE